MAADRVAPNGAVTGAFRVIVTAVADRSDAAAETTESFSVTRPNGSEGPIVVSAGGERGLVYALAELADRVEYSADPLGALREVEPTTQRPQAPLRSILRTFACEVEDKPWFYDRGFWTEYLTELAVNRVNRFQLALGMQYNYPHHPASDNYLCFPYPFLLEVPGFDVQVDGLSADERAEPGDAAVHQRRGGPAGVVSTSSSACGTTRTTRARGPRLITRFGG